MTEHSKSTLHDYFKVLLMAVAAISFELAIIDGTPPIERDTEIETPVRLMSRHPAYAEPDPFELVRRLDQALEQEALAEETTNQPASNLTVLSSL